MIRLFNNNPDFQFSTNLFKNSIRGVWNTYQEATE